MSTVLLSAASSELPSLQALGEVVVGELERSGETDLRVFELATTPLAYCQGEFDCWVKTPGVCRAHDAEESIVRAIHDAEHLIMLDVVTFGGHSYTLKRAQDRLICLLTPFFQKRASLTHHDARYEHRANAFALGWTPVNSPEQSSTWNALASANALNMLAPRVGAAVFDDRSRDEWAAGVRDVMKSSNVPGYDIVDRESLRDALLRAAAGTAPRDELWAPQSVALVVGSAKVRGASVSENLSRTLAARFAGAGIATTTHFATDFLRDDKAAVVARQIADADLFVLVTPLYVDALPALATRALECVAAARAGSTKPARFAALVNCGFPEPEHTRTALRIARHFAEASGYDWSGGLPLGGGGALSPSVPLDAQHGPAEHVKRALDLAAESLAQGACIPTEAVACMVRAPMPDALYRVMGDINWRYQAHRNGVSQAALRARPLDHSTD
jgi:multimeric flavodoxin WrbA